MVDLVFECRTLLFEWERFGLQSFQNDTSLSHISLYVCMCVCVEEYGGSMTLWRISLEGRSQTPTSPFLFQDPIVNYHLHVLRCTHKKLNDLKFVYSLI